MQYSEPLPSAAIAWAERQSGVLTRAQLISFGLHDSQVARPVRQQVLRRLDRGIYILGVLEPTWHQYAWGAGLLGGRSARLIGASAGVFEDLTIPSLPILLSVDSTVGVQSPLEYRWIKSVERPHRLPIPARPYQLPSGAVADGAYEEFRVLLELDGRRYHDGDAATTANLVAAPICRA